MARRRRSRSSGYAYGIPSRRLLDPLTPFLPLSPLPRSVFPPRSLPGDRRFYAPHRHFTAVQVSGHPSHRLVVPPKIRLRLYSPPVSVGFHAPHRVAVCVRRKERREVLFAERRTGKGSRASRRRRDRFSDISC